jgi:two-component system response regulator YesN
MIKLLIVDDESLLRQGLRHMTDWPAHGFAICGEAANGQEALELIANQTPDIVITDIKMPVMDGIELTRIIKKEYPALPIVILSSYNDFEYVRETLRLGAFDYILKPKMNFADLLAVLEKASATLSATLSATASPTSESSLSEARAEFLTDLLINPHLSLATIRENFQKYRINLAESSLKLLGVVFDSGAFQPKSAAPKLLTATINETIASTLNRVSYYTNLPQVMVAIFNDATPSTGSTNEAICRSLITKPNLPPFSFQLLISDSFDGYLKIPEMYQKLTAAIPYCFYFSKNDYAPLCRFQTRIESIEFDFGIINKLAEGFNFDAIRTIVKDWVQEQLAREEYIEPYILKKFFSEVCYLIIYKGGELGFNWEELNEKKFAFLKKIENCTNFPALEEAFTAIITNLEQLFAAHTQTSLNTVVSNVIKYIRQNYHQNISLESVAKHFYIDKSHLCKLFKKHTGQNFNDYLMQTRIAKAKELLNHPEYTVNSVAPLVGFSDYSYFGRVFKKMAGMTPSEYKKSLFPTA